MEDFELVIFSERGMLSEYFDTQTILVSEKSWKWRPFEVNLGKNVMLRKKPLKIVDQLFYIVHSNGALYDLKLFNLYDNIHILKANGFPIRKNSDCVLY